MTVYCAREPLEDETEETTTPVEEGEDDNPIFPDPVGDDPGRGSWEDFSDLLPITDGLIHMGVCVFNDCLIIAGGYVWNSEEGDYEDSATVMQLNTDDEGSELPEIPTPRGEFAMISFGTKKVLIMGGYTINGSHTFPSEESEWYDMFLEMSSSKTAWAQEPMTGSSDYITDSRIPFPRDACDAIYVNEGDYFFLYAGRCNPLAGDELGWELPSGGLEDLWQGGNLLQLRTPMSSGDDDYGEGAEASESAISGNDKPYGYRYHPSMCKFGNDYVMGGGIKFNVGAGIDAESRDIYVLDISGIIAPRFVRKVFDILDSQPASYTSGTYICDLVEWQGRLLALLMIGGGASLAIWESTNYTTWTPFTRLTLAIESTASSKYIVDGDQTDEIEAGDFITVVGTTKIDQFEITSATLVSGKTHLVLSGVSGTPDPATGTIYVNPFRGDLGSRSESESISECSIRMEVFNDALYLIGGKDETGKIIAVRSVAD